MNINNIRSQGYTVQSFHLFIEESTLQPCMDCHHLRLLPIHLLINLYHFIAERRILTVLPCRICPLDLIFSTQKFCQIFQFIREILSGSLHRTADTGACSYFIFRSNQNSYIRRSLHQSGDGSAHLLNTKRNIHQIEYNLFPAGRMKNSCLLCSFICKEYCNSFICSGIFFTPCFLELCSKGLYILQFLSIYQKLCFRFSCNGIILLSSLYGD